MSSSTKTKGATMPRTRIARTSTEPATIAVSHAQVGTRRRALPKVDLGEAPGDLVRLGRLRRDPDVRRCLTHGAEHRVVNRPAAGDSLQRADVQIRDALDVVLAVRERRSVRPHLHTDIGARREQLDRCGERRHLVVVWWNLQRDIPWKLREPAHIADDERLAE